MVLCRNTYLKKRVIILIHPLFYLGKLPFTENVVYARFLFLILSDCHVFAIVE